MLHFAWLPRYKKRELQGALAENLKEFFYECAEVNGWHIAKLEIELHHVYMVVVLDPDVSPDAMIKTFKQNDKSIRTQYPDFEEFCWGNKFWADGYFVVTEGCYDENARRQYIAECRCVL